MAHAEAENRGLVEAEDAGGVRRIVMRRAEKRNALNEDLIRRLDAAFRDAASDPTVRVVVLAGEGEMFSAGMDIASLQGLASDPGSLRSFRTPLLETWNLLEDMEKPTICEIHGACIGGAMELALAADLRVMAEDAKVGLVEARVGLLPDVGGCSRLPAVVGLGVAKELVMTGRLIDGREAHRIGFANRVAPAAELGATTKALCDELLACAPLAVGLAKRVMNAAARPGLAESLEREVDAQERLARSEDFAEGARAFGEKRQPAFTGA
jgi:enoyl-CoA hydratase/carnithine racemase